MFGRCEMATPARATEGMKEPRQHWWWLARKRWLVRYPKIHHMHNPEYELFIGRRPYLRHGRWIGKDDCSVCAGCLESLLPKEYHLEPGGGPVELKG